MSAKRQFSIINRCVCPDCFDDYAIKKFISAKATAFKCSYCNQNSATPIAAEMDAVLGFISRGLRREYDIPENVLSFDSGEGGWQGMDPIESWDLFVDLFGSNNSEDLFDDLVEAFSGRQWVPRHPFIMSESDGLKYSWSDFCRRTKHEVRFVLFKVRPPRRKTDEARHPDDQWGRYSPPYEVLLGLGRMARRHQLIKSLPAGTTIVRARQHPSADSPSTASQLGAPPPEYASQSRMSPAGIPMLYGASDETTAFLEVFDPKATAKDCITFGTFKAVKALNILDLSNLPRIPSIFDETHVEERPALIFLHQFQQDISAPIGHDDGRHHFEYVPTQIVAEYFRHVFRVGRRSLDGLMFNSSRKGANVSYCFFPTLEEHFGVQKVSSGHLLSLQAHSKRTIDFVAGSYH